MRNNRRIGLACCAVALICGCASVESARMKNAARYVARHTELPGHIRNGILEGKVVLTMTPEQAYQAAGARVTEDPNHAMWEVADGRLQFPPSVIKPGTSFQRAETFSNITQFQTEEPVLFIVYYNRDNHVEHIKKATPPDFLDGKSWIMPDSIPPRNFRTRTHYE